MIELFSLSLQAKKIVGGLIPLDVGTSLKSRFSPRNISYVPRHFKNVFGASILNHLSLRNYHVVIKTCMSDVRNIHRPRSRSSTPGGALRTQAFYCPHNCYYQLSTIFSLGTYLKQ